MSIEVIYPSQNCAIVTFEGGGSLTPIPDVNANFTVVQFPGWITTIDSDAGGASGTANEPSPDTTAAWLPLAGFDDFFREIIFTNPVSSVKLFYASIPSVTLEAYDGNNTLIGSVSGNGNFNTGPGGDPTGDFDKFDELSIDVGMNRIKKVKVIGQENVTVIDNLTLCTVARGLFVES
ncbi:hypothetical protein GCM10008905_24490 [Clostridium malenominatum]|uniref:Uncharacterized protein n=1 Tax=Clostridium malenominatum TaxID=1539 RepID=A0ABN1J359_9CLOT